MKQTGSSQLSQELKIYKICGLSSRNNCVLEKGKGRVNLTNASLASHGLRLDAWTLHFVSSRRQPIRSAPSRCNVFVCRSLLTPSGGDGISAMKSAAVVLMRSFDALSGCPLLRHLIPAFGVIAFASMGLGPLMRIGRVIFLHKSDKNWKKSSTHYVLTSYLQPLLLWTGAILICRALDPVILQSEASQAVKQRLLNFIRSLSTVLAFAYCLSSLIQQAQKFYAEMDDSCGNDAKNMGFSFAGKAVYSAVWVAAVSLFMELLGFSTQKWVTAGGLGTVLITLAGREIFTNFLSSVMIHATRPFVLNEWIQTKIEGYEVSGTVEHVGWWSPTVIRGDDREAVHIPNHKFTMNVVRNLSQKTHWRIKTHLAISHLDVHKVNNIVADMRKVLAKNPQIEQQRLHRRVFLDFIDRENQALMILVSCFVKTSHFEEYLCVKEAVLLDLLRVISHHRARLATPIRTVRKMYIEADLDNIPFADTIFAHSRAAANHRPFLLIEPSYKIKSDDKTTASTQSGHTNNGKDGKGKDGNAEAASKPGSKLGSAVTNHEPSKSEDDVSVQNKSETGEASRNMENLSKDAGLNPEELNVGGATPEEYSAISQAQHYLERPVTQPSVLRPPLEENIVLGVALEGSKRTLPIEDESDPALFSSEPNELAASRDGGGSVSAGKDMKDGQTPTVAGASQVE